MALQVGDKVQEQARSTERASRTGVIEDVVRGDPSPRYRIRWDDGRESVYTPAAGCLHKLPATAGAPHRGKNTRGRRLMVLTPVASARSL
jgi:Domain of unknown function (DUF1918)